MTEAGGSGWTGVCTIVTSLRERPRLSSGCTFSVAELAVGFVPSIICVLVAGGGSEEEGMPEASDAISVGISGAVEIAVADILGFFVGRRVFARSA